MASVCTPEEMAWREYLAQAQENTALIRQFERMANRPRPLPPADDGDSLVKWATGPLHEWHVAYRHWLTTRYGWQHAPHWLVEETARDMPQ